MSLSPMVLRRLTREIAHLQKSPPEGIAIEIGEHDLLDINGWIRGPAGTPYAGGYFRVNFSFVGSDFPAGPPRCTMRTKVFHPNIAANGEICVSTLKKDWSSTYGIEHILVVIKCLLISPNPDSALDPEAGRLLQEAYSDYASTAAIWTRVHATYRPECMPVDPQEPSSSRAPKETSMHGAAAMASSIEPPTASFQALALHPHKKREIGGKVGSDGCAVGSETVPASSGAPLMSSLGITAQPLRRSGSTNADLKHKSSFDIAARSGSGVANGPMAPSAISPMTAAVMTTTSEAPYGHPSLIVSRRSSRERGEDGDDGQRQQSSVLGTSLASTTTLSAETDHVTQRLCDVSLESKSSSVPSCTPSAASARRVRPVAVVRRGIKRL